MVSGSTNGVIEAWLDGEKIYTYTGDVNHGLDFADIYLQSDGAGTFFSNVIISNKKLDFGDGCFDVERDVTKTLEINFDVERVLIAPIIGVQSHYREFLSVAEKRKLFCRRKAKCLGL